MLNDNKLSRFRLEFSTSIFVRECLRQYVKMHPGVEPDDLPMKALCDYPKREQQALMKAIEKAIEASTGMDETYKLFLQTKIDGNNDAA